MTAMSATAKRRRRIPFGTTVETITPADARKYLQNNGPDGGSNRKLKPQAIADFAAAITRGEWLTTHQGIAFDWYGNLIDGQHRLHAITVADRAVTMVVTRGLDPKTFIALDTGSARSAADVLSISGEDNPVKLAAITRLVLNADAGRPLYNSTRSRVTHTQIEEFLTAQPGIRDFVARGDSLRAALHLNAAALGAAAYLCERANPLLDVTDWYAGVETGTNLKADDPRLLLRRTCARLVATRSSSHRTDHVVAYYVQAFNAWATGATPQRLVLRSDVTGGKSTTIIPKPISVDLA